MRLAYYALAIIAALGCRASGTSVALELPPVPFYAQAPGCDGTVPDSLVEALRAKQGGSAQGVGEEPPLRFAKTGRLEYPRELNHSVDGRVEVEFIVRDDGSVDPCSIRILAYSQREFIVPAVHMVASSTFTSTGANGNGFPVLVRIVLNSTVE